MIKLSSKQLALRCRWWAFEGSQVHFDYQFLALRNEAGAYMRHAQCAELSHGNRLLEALAMFHAAIDAMT